jgi:hypothetical protein
MSATLVVGTIATVATTQSAFAYAKKPRQDHKKTRENGSGNRDGNTVTALKCQSIGSASGFDTSVNQECQNTICTHPGVSATCVSESSGTAAGGGVGGLVVCHGEPGVVGLRAILVGDKGREVCVALPGRLGQPVPQPPCSAPLVPVRLVGVDLALCAIVLFEL